MLAADVFTDLWIFVSKFVKQKSKEIGTNFIIWKLPSY